MVTTEQQQQFRKQGYIIFNDVFSAAQMNDLSARIDHFAEEHEKWLREHGKQGISRPKEISFTSHLAAQDPEIMKFVVNPFFVELTSTLLQQEDVSLYWDQSVYKKPETKREFPWHQDTGYVLTDPAEYITCWLALEDATLENGCIWIVPESHKQGVVEHKNTDIGKQCYFGEDPGIPVPLKKGSLVAFSSLLFHRSGPNTSESIRKGYVIQYSVAHARHGETGELFNRVVIARNGQPTLV